MDNLTHTVTGLVLARAGADRLAPYATAALVVTANAADLDYFSRLAGAEAYLEHRFGATHSLLGATVLGLAFALLVWPLARRRGSQPGLLLQLLLVCLLGTFSHVVLDWSTSYGAKLLWPAKQTRYALDFSPFLDPSLLVILLLGLGLPALLRLVGEEIGARRSERGARWGAWVALAACALLAAGRATLHADAVAQLESRLYHNRTPVRAGAFPTPLSPFRWNGVVETATTFETVELAALGPGGGHERFSTFYKPSPSLALEAALATRTARVFLDWARFPHAEVSPYGEGWRIRMRDLRYAAEASRPRRLVVWIELNQELEVVRERLSIVGTARD